MDPIQIGADPQWDYAAGVGQVRSGVQATVPAHGGAPVRALGVPLLVALVGAGAVAVTSNNLWGNVVAAFDGHPADVGAMVSVPSSGTQFQTAVSSMRGAAPVPPETHLQLSVIVDGVPSANTLPFTVTG
ncbi:MAG: hypothetical protein M1314_03480 [Firmicutes bacterium]|nr:hypothetical protein [Bacillota bacterium]